MEIPQSLAAVHPIGDLPPRFQEAAHRARTVLGARAGSPFAWLLLMMGLLVGWSLISQTRVIERVVDRQLQGGSPLPMFLPVIVLIGAGAMTVVLMVVRARRAAVRMQTVPAGQRVSALQILFLESELRNFNATLASARNCSYTLTPAEDDHAWEATGALLAARRESLLEELDEALSSDMLRDFLVQTAPQTTTAQP